MERNSAASKLFSLPRNSTTRVTFEAKPHWGMKKSRGCYQGSPCKRCGATDRRNGECVPCKRRKDRLRNQTSEYREKNRERSHSPEARLRGRLWHQTAKAKEARAARLANPEWRAKERIKSRARKYGLKPDAIRQLFEQQKGRCASCDDAISLEKDANVDHDHETGQVRGLLCRSCNLAEGLLKSSPLRAYKLAAYLERRFSHSRFK
jgi:hypothetical protein